MNSTAIASTNQKLIRWPYLACGMILFLFMGILYAWSLIAGPLETEFGWNRTETSLVFTICMFVFAIGGITGGFVANKKPLRYNIIISALLLLIGFIASSFVTEIWHIYITYGVVTGFAVGFSYGATINAVVQWYPDKPGFASGTLLVAFGLSSLIIGTPITWLFNTIGIRSTFRVMGVVFSVAMVVVVLFMKSPSPDTAFPEAKSKGQAYTSDVADLTTSQALRRPSMWLWLLWEVGTGTIGLAAIGQAATSAATISSSITVAAIITGGLSIANGLSRMIWGILCDTLGIRKVAVIVPVTISVGVLCAVGAFRFSNTALLIVGFLLVGAAYGGSVTFAPNFVRRMYGAKYYASNYSLYYISTFPESIIGPMVLATVYTMTNSYAPAFLIVLAIGIAMTIPVMFVRKA